MSSEKQDQKPARLLMASNRLQVTCKRIDENNWSFGSSSGGLASGLAGLLKTTPFQWYGWPGVEVQEEEAANKLKEQLIERNAIPVFLTTEQKTQYYDGFSSTFKTVSEVSYTDHSTRLNNVASFPLSPRRDHLR
jgi:trehalose 6-phosphate synthase